jgi:MYXO-CTERM domain-containing protein
VLSSTVPAKADVLPPPEPLECGRGQVVATDHGGTHCEYKHCAYDHDCPPGMPCVARAETYCDPRGEPCSTSEVKRCSDPASGPGAVPGGRAGCGCEVGPRRGSLPSLGLAALLMVLATRRRRYS